MTDAREALGILVATKDTFSAQVEDMVSWKISGKQWNDVLNSLIPMTDKDGAELKGRGLTMAQNRRGEIQNLWTNDTRVAPWKGTAFGVMQAFNTWDHHFRGKRGDTIVAERNMIEAINGKQDERDMNVLNVLQTVAAR